MSTVFKENKKSHILVSQYNSIELTTSDTKIRLTMNLINIHVHHLVITQPINH